MKFTTAISSVIALASVTLAEPCQFFEAKDVMNVSGAIVWQFWETNPPAWSWNADTGNAVVQQNGAVYFDGNGLQYSNTIRIVYKNGMTALVQPPNGENGWCQLPDGKQNDIENITSWD